MKKNLNIFVIKYKNLILGILLFILVIFTGTYLHMNQPLDMYYSTEKYGAFVVQDSMPNKHQYIVTLTSTNNVEHWRLQCLYNVRYFIPKSAVQPEFVNGEHRIPLTTNLQSNKPITMSIQFNDEKSINFYKRYKCKKMVENILKYYELEMNPVFTQEGAEGYEQIFNICN